MDKRDVEAEQSNMKGGESAGGGFANPGEHGLGGGYTGTLKDITGGQNGGFKDLTGRACWQSVRENYEHIIRQPCYPSFWTALQAFPAAPAACEILVMQLFMQTTFTTTCTGGCSNALVSTLLSSQ